MELESICDPHGIAANEDTALIVNAAGIATVVANEAGPTDDHSVYIFDTSIATYGSNPPLPSLIYSGVIVTQLRKDQQINLNTWQPVGMPTETYYVDVDWYQPWFVRKRNFTTNAIDDIGEYGTAPPSTAPIE
jgi:hypothetical protein